MASIRILVSTLLVLCGILAGCGGQPSARYMYVLGCAADVDKLDTVSGTLLATVPLSKSTGQIPEVRGAPDGCLANGAVYLPARGIFYTAVPVSARQNAQGRQQYRVLSFQIPDFRFLRSVSLPGDLADPPELLGGAHGLYAWEQDRAFLVTDGGTQAAPAETTREPNRLDLAGYGGPSLEAYALQDGGHKEIPAAVIETSGDKALVRVTGAGSTAAFAVADRSKRQVQLLTGLPQTYPQNVHLAPGGGAVVVEEAKQSAISSQDTDKTGRLLLLDAASGRILKDWAVPGLEAQAFLAIAPNGKLVYNGTSQYRFIETDGTYPNEPVRRESGTAYFFAAK